MGDKDEKLDGGFDQEEKPEVDAAQPEPVVKAPEPKAEPQPVESPKKKQVTAPAKKAPYAAGAKTLAPDTFKPGPEGKSAIGELTAFLQKNPSPAEIGQFLSKMQAQGRIGPASMAEVRKVIEKARGPEVAQRAIALAGFGGVVAGALGTQAEAPKTKAAPAPKASLAPVVQKKEEPGQKKGWYSSVKGWFSKGAEKVGNAASSVATATKNAYNRTKTALSDTWDVLSSSKVGYSKGTVTLETDVDELQDFLPQTKSMLALDKTKKADNKVSVAFDTKAKVMTVSAPSLAVSGMNFKGLRTGPAVITGVFVRITNPGHLKGGKALVDKNNPNDMQISVSVGSVTANAVAFQSAKGPISAQQAILNGITIWMKNSGGKVPFTDDAPDNINAGFKVGSMVLRGVEGAGVKADSLSVDNASALMDQGKETLDMGVGRIKAQGASYKGNKVTETEATDLSAHVDNKGGGLVGMDDKKDTLAKAEVTVGGVNVKDLKLTGGEAIQTLKAKGIKGTAENGGQQASVSVDKTAVTGLNSKQGSLASGEVGGLSASVDQTKKQAGAHIDYANLQGIAGSGAKVDSVGITSVSGTHDYGANHLSVSAGALDVKGADFSKFEHVRRDTAPDTVPATTTPGGTAAPTTPTTAKPALTTDFSLGKATVDDLKINPKSSVAHIGAENISGGSSGSDFNASVGHLGMRGVDTEKVDVGSVDVNGISATHHEGLKAKVKSVQARDIGVAGVGHIDEAHASGISGSKTGDFTTSGTVNSFGASGIDAGKAQVSSVEGKGLAGSFNSKKGFSAAVKDVDVGQTTAGEAGFQSAHLSDLKAGSSPKGGMHGSLGSASVQDLSLGGGKTVGSVSVTDAAGQMDKDKAYTGSVKQVAATDIDLGKASVQSAHVDDLSAAGQGKAGEVRVGGGGASGIGVDGVGTVGEAGFKDLKVKSGGDGSVSGSLGGIGVQNVDAKGVKADSLSAHGIQGSADAKGMQGSASVVTAGNLQAGGETVKTGFLKDVSGSYDKEQQTAQGGIGSGTFTGISGDKASASSAHFSGLSGSTNLATKDTQAGLQSASVYDLKTDKGNVGGASIQGLKASTKGLDHADVSLDQADASLIDTQNVDVRSASVKGAKASLDRNSKTGETSGSVGIDKVGAQGIAVNQANFGTAGVNSVDVQGLKASGSVGPGGPKGTFHTDKAQADGISVDGTIGGPKAPAPGLASAVSTLKPASPTVTDPAAKPTAPVAPKAPEPPPLDVMKLAHDEIDHVKDASVALRIPMIAGDYGKGISSTGVEPGEYCTITLAVKDGFIQPEGTKIEFSKGLDAALWMTAKGVYVEKDGTVKVDLRGFFDIGITEQIAGKGHKQLPLKLTELMDVIQARAAAAKKDAGGAGGGGSGGGSAKVPDKKPSKPTKPKKEKPQPKQLDQAFDKDHISGSAAVSLNPGQVKVGDSSVTLKKGGPQTNAVQANMNEHQELAATFVEFLLGAFDLKMGGTQVSGGETSAKGGKIDLKPDKAGGGMKVHGTVGSVKTENVNGSMGK